MVVSPNYIQEHFDVLAKNGLVSKAETEVFILIDGKIAGSIALADAIRTESKEAIQQLKKENIKSVLVSGT